MKKYAILLLAGAISAMTLVGCGGSSADKPQQQNTQVEAEIETESVDWKLMEPAAEFAGGDGTEENPYQISTAEELYRLAYVLNSSDLESGDVSFDEQYYVLTNDITVNDVSDFDTWADQAPEYGWEPISYFQGHFDGGGYAITGLYCAVPETEDLTEAGLFGRIDGGTVENLTIEEAMVINPQAGCCAGIVASVVQGAQIRNCRVSGVVISSGLGQGGVVGSATWSFVENCSFAGSVVSEDGGVSGGVLGNASGCVVTGCKNTGSIEVQGGFGDTAGGVVGSFAASSMGFLLDQETYPDEWSAVEAQIENVRTAGISLKGCVNEGTVWNSEGVAGGVVGEITDGLGHEYRQTVVVDQCVNDGAVSSGGGALTAVAAGICGWYATSPAIVEEQRIVGSLELKNCTNNGEIVSKGGSVGGVLGYANMTGGALTVDACANTGAVSVEDGDASISLGGIVGGAGIYEDVTLRFENMTDRTAYEAGMDYSTGGIIGSVTVAESNEGELTFLMSNCQGLGTFSGEEGATYGALCGSFLGGILEDDFAGTFEMESCKCAEGVPAVGVQGSLTDKLAALIEAIEETSE